MRYIPFTFSFIFFSVTKVLFSKKIFQYKTFYPYKNIFFCKQCIFCKNHKYFFKNNFFLNLVLQQMNNHSRAPLKYKCLRSNHSPLMNKDISKAVKNKVKT